MRDATGITLAQRVHTLITAAVAGQPYEPVGPLAMDIWAYQVTGDTSLKVASSPTYLP
jgi:hypothetical protein